MPTFTEFGISDTAGFNNAIAQINAAISGTFVIDLLNNITLNGQLSTIVSAPGVAVTINGSGSTLSGNDTFRGLFVYSGAVTIENLQISHAVARGGDAEVGGGGAAGLGGGLFVADDVANGAVSAGAVTLINVGFDHDQAIGGNGASQPAGGGGGGMGGSANNFPNPGPAIGPNNFGVGGAYRGNAPGFGGGGNAGFFGDAGGNGGYGGGGGGANNGGTPGQGGFGGGAGNADAGGGGLGAGGDVFVQQGAGLTILGGTMSNGTVAGGVGAGGSQAYGSGIFIQGNGAIHLGTGSVAGQITTVNGAIADETGSSGQNLGEGTVFIDGAGTVALGGTDPFAGAAVLDGQATSSTLDLGAVGAAGGGVEFEGPATLRLENGAFSNHNFGSTIIGFGYADVIDIPGLDFAAGAQAQYNASTHTLTVSSGGASVTLNVFAPIAPSFSVMRDGGVGTEVVEALNAAPPGGTSAEMIMRNSNTGQFEIYDVGHNAILSAATLGLVELRSTQSQWQLAGLGSFNAGDNADMLLRNTATGAFEAYYVSGNNITDAALVGTVGTEWNFAGTGSFDGGSNLSELLLRNASSGAFELYQVAGGGVLSGSSVAAVGNNFSVKGFGHFSESGTTQMMMQDTSGDASSGQLELYTYQPSTAAFAGIDVGAVGSNLTVVGMADLLGNGATQMVMQQNNGNFWLYTYNPGSNTLSGQLLGAIGSNFHVVGFGPLGSSGQDEMLMQDAAGDFEAYQYNAGINAFVGTSMGTVGSPWVVDGIAPNSPTGGAGNVGFAPYESAADVVASSADSHSIGANLQGSFDAQGSSNLLTSNSPSPAAPAIAGLFGGAGAQPLPAADLPPLPFAGAATASMLGASLFHQV